MKRFFLLILLLVFISACTAAPKTTTSPASIAKDPGTPWPTKGWSISTPEEQGIDPVKLKKALQYIKDSPYNFHSLLVIRNGYIVSETYYQSYSRDTKQEIYSVTKSFIATLIGIAEDQGKIRDVNMKVLDEFFPGRTFDHPDPRKQTITLENLLSMTSGLDWYEGDSSFNALYRSGDWTKWMLDLPMAADPGKEFKYCSGCSHVLSTIVRETTGAPTEAFAKQSLFGPLGITNYTWDTDSNGIAIGGWGLKLTPRDMAKLGYLYLHNGMWDGRQIVSANWVKTATSKHTSTSDTVDYGYQWWLYPDKGAYAALGRGGQTIYVVPAKNLIIVTTADLPGGHDPVFDVIDNFIMPAVQ